MSSLLFPGTNRSGDCGPQLDVLESVLEEAWDKLEQFENKKRSNLIFYGVRGETRETQADLIQKVRKIFTFYTFNCFLDINDYSLFSKSQKECDSSPCSQNIVWTKSWELQVYMKY